MEGTLTTDSVMFRIFSPDIAIDLGTANTLVYTKGRGICLNEPSMVAIREDGSQRRVVAIGAEAKKMLGRTPEGIKVLRPMRAGVIADFETAGTMLDYFLRAAEQKRFSLIKPRIVVGIPASITEVEKRAIRDSGQNVGAREVRLIDEAMAAALGCGLPVTEPVGSLIVDIGGGTTDIAVISLKDIIYANSLRLGGDAMDEAIIQYVRREHRVLIGEATAELIKMTIGTVHPKGDKQEVQVKGRSLTDGHPATITISAREVRIALEDVMSSIITGVRSALEAVPPEVAGDIVEYGICLTGGGALIGNIALRFAEEFKLPIHVPDDPLTAVVMGAGKCLDNEELYRELLF